MICKKCGSNINLPKKALIKEVINGHNKIKILCKECGEEYVLKLILDVNYYIEGDDMEILSEDYVSEIEEVEKPVEEVEKPVEEVEKPVEEVEKPVEKPVKGLRKFFKRKKKERKNKGLIYEV